MNVTYQTHNPDPLYATFTVTGATPPLHWGWGDGEDDDGPDLIQGHQYAASGLYVVQVGSDAGTKPLIIGLGSESPDAPEAVAAAGETAETGEFDPGDHTVAEVLAHVDANPDDLDRVLADEEAGKARVTLLEQLESRVAAS